MKAKIKDLINDLKGKSQNPFSVSRDLVDPEAKVNVWYVIARLEEALLEEK